MVPWQRWPIPFSWALSKGIEAKVRTVPEVFPSCEQSTQKTSLLAPPFVTREEVRDCAALILGSPTRFGNMARHLSISSIRSANFGYPAR